MDTEQSNSPQITSNFVETHSKTFKAGQRKAAQEAPAGTAPGPQPGQPGEAPEAAEATATASAQTKPNSTATAPAQSQPIISGYAATHCATCAAGMLLQRPNGTGAAYCLIVRDWMSDEKGQSMLLDCSRWEAAAEN